MRSILPPVALAALALAAAAPAVPAAGGTAGGAPASCELRLASGGGSITLTALARASGAAQGRYTLLVTGPGTTIRQGGPFRIGADGTATLGTIGLDPGGAGYEAELALDLGGRTLSCTRRIPGGI